MKIKAFKYNMAILIVSVMVLVLSINLKAQKLNTENKYDKKEKTTVPVLEIVEKIEIATCDGMIDTNEFIVIEDNEGGCQGEEPLIYFIVEKMPEFPGGDLGLTKYIQTNIKYPNVSGCTIEGKVYIHFCVTDSGTVDKISVARGVDPLLDKEAVRVVSTLPKWIPGEQKNGEKVSVWYTVPVLFRLE